MPEDVEATVSALGHNAPVAASPVTMDRIRPGGSVHVPTGVTALHCGKNAAQKSGCGLIAATHRNLRWKKARKDRTHQLGSVEPGQIVSPENSVNALQHEM